MGVRRLHPRGVRQHPPRAGGGAGELPPQTALDHLHNRLLVRNLGPTKTPQRQYHFPHSAHYLVLYTQSLNSFTFAFRTLPEQQQLKASLTLFVREAQLYFTRLMEFDPFKAEAMMTFL